MKYYIPKQNLEKLSKKINRAINKGAPITFTIGQESYLPCPNNEKINYLAVEVEVEGSYIINGWRFIATLDHREAGNIIRRFDYDITIPEYFRTCKPHCDHCGVSRYRKDTYIIYNETEDKFMQVGKSCLKDFTCGLDANICAEIASIMVECEEAEEFYFQDEEIKEFIRMSNYTPLSFSLNDVIPFAYNLVKYHGYAKEKSSELLYDNILGKADVTVKNCSSEESEEFINWVKALNTSNDYNYSLNVIISDKYIQVKDFNYILSALSKFFKEKVNAEQSTSEYVGNIGDKIDIEVESYRVLFENHYEIAWHTYANSYTYELKDRKGNIYILKTSKKLDLIETDDGFNHINVKKIRATVDDHREYKSIKQTYIKRFKLLDYDIL